MSWQAQAACREYGPDGQDLWFSMIPSWMKRAVEICNTCPVQARCLEWAINNRIEYGIWGGKLPGERKHRR